MDTGTDAAGGTAVARPVRDVACYVADVVERLVNGGLPVDRAVVEPGRGGRIVFDDAGPPPEGCAVPVLARWDASAGWSLDAVRPGSRPMRADLCGPVDPAPSEVEAFVARSIAPREPRPAAR